MGKAGGKPTEECPFCNSSSSFMTDGELYCLDDLLHLHRQYIEAWANHMMQKYFDNVINLSLTVARPDQLVLVLYRSCIYSLYLLTSFFPQLRTMHSQPKWKTWPSWMDIYSSLDIIFGNIFFVMCFLNFIT